MNNRITIQFISDNKILSSIQCLKVFSENQLNKIKGKISLIKDGAVLYPAKYANDRKNIIFLAKDGTITSKNNAVLAIETTNKIIKEIKNCNKAKIIGESIEKIQPTLTWKEVKDKSMDVLKKAEQARVNATEAEAKMETIVEIKDEPKIEKSESEDDKLDKTLTMVLESIQKKMETQKEQKTKEETEMEKLRMELTRKKLELIEMFLKANKE